MDAAKPPGETRSARLSAGARWLLAALLVTSLWTGTSRFIDPGGDGYVAYMPPGSADLYYPYHGACALLRGLNPYRHDAQDLFDPWGRDEPIDGVMFRQFYPPSHFILDLPLVLVTAGDVRRAGRVLFACSVLALGALAGIAVTFARRLGAVREDDVSWLLAGALTLALATSPGVMLGLVQGQSDFVLALCTWGGALLLLERRGALSMFLVSIPVVCKGYSVLAAGGLLALALADARTRRGAVLGVGAAAGIFVLPVLHLLPDGVVATRFRSNMFSPVPYNSSFKNLASWVDPSCASAGRAALMLLALAGTALCFAGAWRATRAEPDGAASEARVAWTILFMTGGLVTMIGGSSLSCSYNLVYVLPGALILGLSAERVGAAAGVGRPVAFGRLLALSVACLSLPRFSSPSFPIGAVGLVLLVALVGWCGVGALRRAPVPGPG